MIVQPPVTRGNTMNTMTRPITRLLLLACLVTPLAACEEEAPPEPVQQPLVVPTSDDLAEWRPYVSEVVRRNMGTITSQPYVYLLPAESTPGFEGLYTRLAEKAQVNVARGIISGNMLAYASPSSSKMADIVIASFKDVPPDTMQGVRVLFIGDAADNARVNAAVSPAGVTYQFIETK